MHDMYYVIFFLVIYFKEVKLVYENLIIFRFYNLFIII